MINKVSNQSKFSRCIRAPYRILCRARDLYVQSITNCAGKVSHGGVVRCHVGSSTLPKSFSVNSARSNDDEDFRELIRAASSRSLENRVDMELRLQQQWQSSTMAKGVPRSYSVGIGKIDEDKPCDFGDDIKVRTDLMYPRSRSYAVTKKTGVFAWRNT